MLSNVTQHPEMIIKSAKSKDSLVKKFRFKVSQIFTKCIQALRDAFENVKKDGRLQRRQEFDVILSQAFEEDVISRAELWIFLKLIKRRIEKLRKLELRWKSHQQIFMRNGQNQLCCSIHDGIKCIITVQFKHAEVHVVAAKNRLQHEKANGDAFEAHLVDLIFGNVDREDSVAVTANQFGSLSKQQISIGTRNVKHQPLRSVLNELSEKLQHGCGNGWIVRPNLNGANKNRRVSWINPVEEHHVRSLLVKAVSQAADVASQSDECVLHLFTRIHVVQHHASNRIKCI